MASLALGVLALGCKPRQSQAQSARSDLYACDGCDIVFERDPTNLTEFAQIAPVDEPGMRLSVVGRVVFPDGVTAASGVIIYVHQTNAEGVYSRRDATGTDSPRNQRLEGWLKTDADGQYRFDTIKPAPYPSMTMPAHIHLYVAEPGRPAYYIDDIVFAGEFGVDQAYVDSQELRGGSGIVNLQQAADGSLVARRDIVLERHP